MQVRELQDKSAKIERGLERKTLELSSIEQEIAKVKQYDEGAAKARREARWAKMATIEEDINQDIKDSVEQWATAAYPMMAANLDMEHRPLQQYHFVQNEGRGAVSESSKKYKKYGIFCNFVFVCLNFVLSFLSGSVLH